MRSPPRRAPFLAARGPISPRARPCKAAAPKGLAFFFLNYLLWLHVKKRTKSMLFSDSARSSPHRTAKPSRGCLPLAHPRALPAVILSDRRSPSAMCEFPFGCWGCVLRRRTGLVFACFAPQNRQKREEGHMRKAAVFSAFSRFLPVCFGFPRKSSHRHLELDQCRFPCRPPGMKTRKSRRRAPWPNWQEAPVSTRNPAS